MMVAAAAVSKVVVSGVDEALTTST